MGKTGLKVRVQISYTDDWLKVEVPVDAFSIKSAKVTFKTDAATSVYLDRLELLARSHFTNTVMLEKLKVKLTKDYSLSEAEFGDRFDTLHDTINSKVEDGDIALSIVAKQ